eukprot:scaffold111859_cov21-Tisochrysis_lutea.AAC.1
MSRQMWLHSNTVNFLQMFKRKQPPACTPASISLVCMKRLCQTRYALEHNQPHKNTPAAVFCEHGETWPSNAPCVVLHSCELCLAHHTAFKVKQISQLATQYTAYDAKKISYLTAQHTANSSEGLVSGYGTSYCIQQLILISRVVHHTANYEQTISSFHALHVTRKTDCASFCMQHEEPVSGKKVTATNSSILDRSVPDHINTIHDAEHASKSSDHILAKHAPGAW